MTFEVSLLGNADRDFMRAQNWYAKHAPDQVDRFIEDFFSTARRLQHYPHSAPVVRRGVRRANLRIFPYQLWYRVHDAVKSIEVIAVLHDRQDPQRVDRELS